MQFFRNHGPFELNYLLSKANYIVKKKYSNSKILSVANLLEAKKNELSFFDNLKYLNDLKVSNASYCLIKHSHIKFLPKFIKPIVSENPLLDFIIIAKFFFPDSCYDVSDIKKLNKKDLKKKFKNNSENLLIAKSAKIGKNVYVGNNTIIKDYCIIGKNVKIGSNCVISNSIIGDYSEISDNTVIGKKGFGFKKINNKIVFIPHFGKVIIEKNCFIGACVTIDRGSFSNTVIGENSFIDNHVQIAHNVKIGKYCFFAAQSGVAGSTSLGNYCNIGGQAGISGHIEIGNNVSIGGGSGVIRNIKSNNKVMGYPATDFRNFIINKKNVN